jgi:glycosyltransferase involved in cell wall biosynthesis
VTALRVTFVFASRGIGGAERSMLRLIEEAHPRVFECRVVQRGPENPWLQDAVQALRVPFARLSTWDAAGFRRLLASDPPDVLYVFGRFRTLAWAIEARRSGCRCVVAAERSAANRLSDRLARLLDRPLVSAYIANSEQAARRLAAWSGPTGPPVFAIPNGIPHARFAHGATGGEGVPPLLCVGNITHNKGQDVLLEAVRRLRPVHPGLRATLVGRDYTKGRFFREAAARGLEDTFTHAGFVDDLAPYLAKAQVLVLPTRRREGMPTALLEGMLAGLAVVASRVGGVSEIVTDADNGLLVAPDDPGALAAAIDRVLRDDVLRRALASAGRRQVLERHGIGAMVENHRLAFQAALARAESRESTVTAVPAPRESGKAKVAHVTTVALSLRYLLLQQLEAIAGSGYPVVAISAPGPDVATVEAHGIPHRSVPMTRRLTPFRDLLALFRLFRVMRRERLTIVHTHTPKPGLLGQMAARLAGVPVVVNTLHGFYFHDRMHPLARRLYVGVERLAARFSDLILSQNPEDVRTAVREGIAPPERIRVLGNGIDLQRFDPTRVSRSTAAAARESLGIPAGAPVVGFVGRRVAEKGLPELLLAMRAVRARHPDARLLVIGPADDEKPDAVGPERARSLGIAKACVFAGLREDMPEMYALMDLFVLPSHREGFPRAAMEATAMRLPCVVTDIRGCRQVVTHETNGLLVPVGDASALAAAILAVLGDPARAREMGEEGRRRARREFDQRAVFATVIAAYEELLRKKGLAAAIPRVEPREESLAAGR